MAGFLVKNWQRLLPMMDLIEQYQIPYNELIDKVSTDNRRAVTLQ